MYQKIAFKEAKQIFIDKGYVPLFVDYTNSREKLLAFTPDGYKVVTTLDRFKNGKMPFIICNRNSYTIENIRKWLVNNNKNFTLESNEFINANTHLIWKCSICNYVWKTTWARIKQGSSCSKCSHEKVASMTRLSINKIKKRLISINPDIEIVSTKYINAGTKLHCRCLIDECSHEWNPPWQALQSGYGCPKCGLKKRGKGSNGIHNKITAERNKRKWLNKSAIVYTIQCFNNEESFFKMGITTRDIKKRFRSKKEMPYNYRIIDIIYTNLYEAIYIENELHEKHGNHKYIPKIKFRGYTECFSMIKN